ncbi:ANR35 protein, partial [Aphelocoma coerulescens]|nr:ANR35 protein [Aphelocoma coerulescens]
RSLGALRERAARLERACREKDGKLKQLLAETEKLSAEVLGLRGRSARLQLQLEVGTVPGVTPATLCNLLSLCVPPVPLVPPSATLCPHPACPPPQVQQKQHRDTVAVYRSHLLQAAQGFMDKGVHAALLRILRAEAEAG